METEQDASFTWLRTAAVTTSDRPTRVPISIYVMWHPRFEDGPALARSVADWWGGVADIRGAGLGIPVHFRSEPWGAERCLPGETAPPSPRVATDPASARAQRFDCFRRPIDLEAATDNIFVPLVDDHMAEDPSWRRDLLDLARRDERTLRAAREAAAAGRGEAVAELDLGAGPRVHLAAIQVTQAWARMPVEVSEIKALYLERWNDSGPESPQVRRARRGLRLRRLLTQALVRLLRELDDKRLPTEVFLSHAKADVALGPGVAERLRDVAGGYGQIEVFYDENDLPSGHDWQRTMMTSASDGAGFIAVLSDRYATRYWCRREIQSARTPRRSNQRPGKPAAAGEPGYYVWTVRPTVVAVTMAGEWSRLVGDLGTVPSVLWKHDDHEQGPAILDQLFREALVAEFHRRYAESLHRRLPAALRPAVDFITWTPDAASLTRLRKAAGDAWTGRRIVAYPGHGFLPTEKEDLDLTLGNDVAFLSFERLSDAISDGSTSDPGFLDSIFPSTSTITSTSEASASEPAPAPSSPSSPRPEVPMIALSVGDADDLAVLGYDSPEDGNSFHVDAAVLRLVRVVLARGRRIGYGGALRDSSNFTQLLLDTVAGMSPPAEPDRTASLEVVADPPTPLENRIAAPFASRTKVGQRASRAGLCRFHVLGDDAAADATPEARALAVAQSLTVMRTQLAKHSVLTLVLAGKRWGFSGWMPGLAEEVTVATPEGDAASDPDQVRVLLLSEYGGASREIARYVLDPDLVLPPCLDLDKQLLRGSGSPVAIARGGDEARARLAARYAAMRAALHGLREVAKRPVETALPRLGINVGEWKDIMRSSSIGHVRRLLKDRVLKEPVLPSP